MVELKYSVIKNDQQYYRYCNILESLACSEHIPEIAKEVELLELLIDDYDRKYGTLEPLDVNPVELLQLLMEEHQLKSKDIAELLKVSTGLVSDILNYKKGFSKESIRILADRFKIRQEAFNQPYDLRNSQKRLAS